MWKKILLAFALALVILGIVIQMQPNTYSVERSTDIAAAPDRIFPLIDDFHRWSEWSPWEKLDPAMKRTYEGPAAGTGAVYRWVGNSQAGEGSMKIAESKPSERETIDLDFLKPFPARSVITFSLQPQRGGTHVNWSMRGDSGFLTKMMGLFSSMDKMIGPDFERGLAQMKTAAEAQK